MSDFVVKNRIPKGTKFYNSLPNLKVYPPKPPVPEPPLVSVNGVAPVVTVKVNELGQIIGASANTIVINNKDEVIATIPAITDFNLSSFTKKSRRRRTH